MTADDWPDRNMSDREARFKLLKGSPLSKAEQAEAEAAGLLDNAPYLEARTKVEKRAAHLRRVELARADTLKPEPVQFLERPTIIAAALNLYVGQPDRGKTTVVLDMVAKATRGILQGDFVGRPLRVLLSTAEDSPSRVLVPRLVAAGADLALVHFVTIVGDDGIEDGLTFPADLPALTSKITETGAELLIVDPVMAHIDGSVDSHRDHSMRRVLAPLYRLAESTGVTVVGIAHMNKLAAGDFTQRVGGSVGLTAAVRSAVLVAADPNSPDDPAARVICHAKHNLSEAAPTRRFRLVGKIADTDPPIETAAIEWGNECALSAEDVLRGPLTERAAPKRDAAHELLHEMLDDGPALRSAIEDTAKDRGISWRTVERAKGDLQIDDEQRSEPGRRGAGPSWWFFPVNGPQSNGSPPPDTHKMADHSETREARNHAGREPSECNGPPGPPCLDASLRTIDETTARDRAHARAAEAEA